MRVQTESLYTNSASLRNKFDSALYMSRARSGVYVPYVQYNAPRPRSAPAYEDSIRRYAGGGPADREERIGAIVRGLFFHTDHYAPVLSTRGVAVVHAAEIERGRDSDGDSDAENQDNSAPAKYRSARTRVAGDRRLEDVLASLRERSAPRAMAKIVETHLHLLAGVSKMQTGDAKIIHFDLKSDKILYDSVRGVPIITGFDVAFRFSDLADGALASYFYTCNDEYAPWCIDIALLASIAARDPAQIDADITDADTRDLSAVCARFAQNNRMFSEGHYTAGQTAEFSKAAGEYVAGLSGKTWRFAVDDLAAGWRTWDVYALCAFYRRVLGRMFDVTGDSAAAKSESMWVSAYVSLLESALLAPPATPTGARRASPQEMLSAVSLAARTASAADSALRAQRVRRPTEEALNTTRRV